MNAILDILKNFWDIIANTNGEYTLADLSILQVVFVALFIYAVFKLVKLMFTNADTAVKTTMKGIKKVGTWRKRKMSSVVCPRCGRYLDKCTCTANKNISLKKRYKKYKAQMKLQKLEAKNKE